MATTRTFVAVDISPAVRNAAAELQRQLAKSTSDVKWVTPDSMHLTLIFLGDLDDRDLVRVCRITTEIACLEPRFTVRVCGVGAFPHLRRPKVLWAGVEEGADALRRIHSALEARLAEAIGYRPEERDYSPHLTLGRLRSDSSDEAGVAMAGHAAWVGGSFDVTELRVYRSELRRDGPEYSVLGRATLGG